MNVFLSGSISMLWSMVNSLQMLVAFPFLSVRMPAVVYFFLKYLATISGFEIIPPEDL